MNGQGGGLECVIGSNGRKTRPNTIIYVEWAFLNPRHGNMPTQEKATGEYPITQYLREPLPIKLLRCWVILVLRKGMHK